MNEHAQSTPLMGRPDTLEGRAAVLHVESTVQSALSQASEPRALMSETFGRGMAGQRASALIDGAQAAAAQGEIRTAVQRGIPCMLYLIATAPAAHAHTDGSGHESIYTLAETGAIVLIARNVQEVIDLGLVGRRLAELLLTPVIVAMDREQTADAIQDVLIPDKAGIESFLGHAADVITCSTFEERCLFGEQRRRLPRFFDVERPVQWGARQPGSIWGRSVAARQAYYQPRVSQEVELQLDEYSVLSGRTLQPLLRYRTTDAHTILLTMGSSVETAESVCSYLRSERHKVGVIGVRSLQPFPGPELLQSFSKAKEILVLERATSGMAGDSPLLQRLRAVLPGSRSRSTPVVHSVLYGMGGLPLRSCDLATLCEMPREERPPLTYLGIDFLSPTSYPKRQVLVDQLRRQHPEVAPLGIHAHETQDIGHVTVGLFEGNADLLKDAAGLLHELGMRSLRGRPTQPAEHAAQWSVARLSWGRGDLLDPGDASPIHIAVVPDRRMLGDDRWQRELAQDATVLLANRADNNDRPVVATRPSEDSEIRWLETGVALGAALLGAMVAAIRQHGVALPEDSRIVETYRRLLADRSPAEQPTVLSEFEKGLQGVQAYDPATGPAAPAASSATSAATMSQALRSWARTDAWFDSLPRFQDQIGVVYASGDPTELTPDPYLPLGVVPPSTTSFRDRSNNRQELPIIDTQACSGCGVCWQSCPDGAIRATAFSPTSLVEWGLSRAKQTGTPADALQRFAGKMNRHIARNVAQSNASLSASELLRDAAGPHVEKAEADQRTQLSEASEVLAVAADPLPLVRCGETLLSLSVDPRACKACGICAAVCPEEAITRVPQTNENLSTTRRQATLHATLPETNEEQATALVASAKLEDIARLQLQDVAHSWLTGGDDAEAGSGARLAMRSVVSTAASLLEGRKTAQIEQIEQLQGTLAERIRGLLSDALPAGDLDTLAAGLQSFGDASVELSSLASRFEKATNSGYVDSSRLSLFVEAARRIADVRWRLERGLNGFGTAPFSVLCLEGAATSWACHFPDNPFRVPVLVDSQGEVESLSQGLLAGQIARFAEGIQDLRHAQLALDRPNEAALDPILRKPLGWNDLSEEEKRHCPPLVVFADEDSVTDHQLQDLLRLAGSDLPVRIVLLTGLSLSRSEPSLAALTQRQAFVAQTSFAYPKHFVRVLTKAFETNGGAWLRVHAPSPLLHGFATERTVERAAEAVGSRALPLYCFDPERPGVFGSRLDLDDNPDVDRPWTNSKESAYTLAHWALGEERFADQLPALNEADSGPLPLVDWLQLPPADRRGRTPFIEHGQPSQRLRVAPALAAATVQRSEIWRTLRELSGVDTPFTERVRAEADRDAHAQFERRQREMEEQHQAQLAAARREVEDRLVEKLEKRLAGLAGYEELLTGGNE